MSSLIIKARFKIPLSLLHHKVPNGHDSEDNNIDIHYNDYYNNDADGNDNGKDVHGDMLVLIIIVMMRMMMRRC